VKVILSSGFNEVEAIQRFTGKGLAGFIQKPYSAAALAEKVKTVLTEPNR
jgi:FixJ family two-component response regulator